MKPEPIPRNPEADVIAQIDALIDDQLAAGPRDDYNVDRYPRCDVCGGRWHGLPGEPEELSGPGWERAEIPNGGRNGCPGAYATDEQAAAYRATRRVYVDQIDGIIRRGVFDTEELAPPVLPPEMQFPRDNLDGPTVRFWGRDTDGNIHELTGRLQFRPQPAAPQWLQNMIARTTAAIGEILGQIEPITVRTWFPGDPAPTPAETGQVFDGEQLPPSADRSGVAGPTGTILDRIQSWPNPFLPDGGLDDATLAADGFQPLGYLSDEGVVTRDDDPPPADGPLCDETHCYCDSPRRCQWNRDTGPAPPVRADVYTPAAHRRRERAAGSRAARRNARRRTDPREHDDDAVADLGAVYDGQLDDVLVSFMTRDGRLYTELAADLGLGGYTIADVEALRGLLWNSGPGFDALHALGARAGIVGGPPPMRCVQCRRHLVDDPDNPANPAQALVGSGRPGEAYGYWCPDCADSIERTRPPTP